MRFNKVTGAAVLLAVAPTSLAVGTATVLNKCPSTTPIYLETVAQQSAMLAAGMTSPKMELFQTDKTTTLNYDLAKGALAGVGVSIKYSTSASGPVGQFEITWASPKINYDLSNIDGNPLSAFGYTVTPSVASSSEYPSCVPLNCPAGTATCTMAYNQPNDNQTRVCADSTDLLFTLCPDAATPKEKRDVHRHHARHMPLLY